MLIVKEFRLISPLYLSSFLSSSVFFYLLLLCCFLFCFFFFFDEIYPLLRRVSVLTGIILNAANMKELHAKPLEFWDADEPLNTSCIEEV